MGGKTLSYDFIKNYIESIGNSYIITTEKEYLELNNNNSNKKIKLKCLCGNIFETTFSSFKYQNKSKCDKCSGRYSGNSRRNSYEYVKKYIESTGLKLLSDVYENNRQKLELLCGCGNKFIAPFDVIKSQKKHRCNLCSMDNIKNKKKLSLEDVLFFINNNSKCTLISKEFLNYSTNLKFLCGCGNEFSTTFDSFKYKNVRQCKVCSSKSIGEDKIRNSLIENKIKFKEQYTFKDLIFINKLRFDFAILDKNENVIILIEYQGIQHYKPQRFGGISKERAEKNYYALKNNDEIKKDYCRENNINLLEIKYTDINNIENILKKEIYKNE